MSSDKKYIEAFHDYEDFLLKKKQYAKAVHVFHRQTAEYNEIIDNLPVKEMESRQKDFLQHERDLHDVMDSFDRALHACQKTTAKLKTLKAPVQIPIGKKSYKMQIVKGEIDVKEL